MQKLSVKYIAERLGLSVGTVSMALRDDLRVSEDTRQRVKALASQLGYQLDADASKFYSRLRRKKPRRYQETVCIFGLGAQIELNLNQKMILEGFVKRMRFLGYETDYQVIPKNPESGRLLAKELFAKGISSCAILPSQLTREQMENVFEWRSFHVVSFLHALMNVYDFVGYDWAYSLQLTLMNSLGSGAKRIGVIAALFSDSIPIVCAGFREALKNSNSNIVLVPHFEVGRPRQTDLTAPFKIPGLHEWFDRENPDLLIITWEPWVSNILQELQLKPNQFPKVMVAGRGMNSPYAGTVHDYNLVGTIGANRLDKKIREAGEANPSVIVCDILTPVYLEPDFSR
jgi:DNA-binding LacI/PurR family transcriptional regulator